MGDDPTREGLIDTPKRVINSYAELFSGYTQDPSEILERTFEETDGYGDIVLPVSYTHLTLPTKA